MATGIKLFNGPDTTCKRCKGRGEILPTYHGWDDMEYQEADYRDCPDCDGTGNYLVKRATRTNAAPNPFHYDDPNDDPFCWED